MRNLSIIVLVVFWVGGMLGLIVGALLAASREPDGRETD
jgi:hypothetical protein